MLSRFVQRLTRDEVAKFYSLAGNRTPARYRPHYNIAPSQTCLILRLDGEQRYGSMSRWGLIPFHFEGRSSKSLTLVSAEAAAGPSFENAFRGRRCLVPCSGFYGWRSAPEGCSQPYLIGMADGSPFALAGLWETWVDPRSRSNVTTFAIVMTEANELASPIMPQMPVIVAPQDWSRWLDAGSTQAARDMLRPYPAANMRAFRVSSQVNDRKRNDPELIAPLN
jgi:putative SOS response-associated peptidase YedK